ncbi:class I SAM-dependent methyltransferase [Candidatus Parcubacteria bacterium]|nr:class I SAM-dependent methyltransferase [Candidatus Parcubacteria bacterium]
MELLREYKDKKNWQNNNDAINLRSDILGTNRVIKILGNVKNKSILDLGCGNGKVARILAKKGAKVVAVDKVREQIEHAKTITKDKNIEYFVGDLSSIGKIIVGEKFDIVLSMMAHLYLPEKDFKKSFKIISSYLKNNGRFIYLNIHPCRILLNNNKVDYFKTNFLKVKLPTLSGKPFKTSYFNHSLELVLNSIFEAGLAVKKIYEPKAIEDEIKKYPKLLSVENKIPSYIIIDSCKN